MTTRVLLVRHGSTELAAGDRFAGSTDVLLSSEGESQARALGARLADKRIDVCWASPMKRTVRTAELIMEPHGGTMNTSPAFKEVNHGHWETLTRSEVESRFPEEYRLWEQDPYVFAPEGGESGLSVLNRALPALTRLVADNEGKTILLVSHKATIRLLIGSFLGFDLRGYRDHLDQSPCSLNVLDFKNQCQARLMLFNDISHYEVAPHPKNRSLSKVWDQKS